MQKWHNVNVVEYIKPVWKCEKLGKLNTETSCATS